MSAAMNDGVSADFHVFANRRSAMHLRCCGDPRAWANDGLRTNSSRRRIAFRPKMPDDGGKRSVDVIDLDCWSVGRLEPSWHDHRGGGAATQAMRLLRR